MNMINVIIYFSFFQNEKSKIEERRKLSEQDVHRLMKEKEHSENIIANLKKDMEAMNRLHEQQLEQIERKAKEMEEQLTTRIKEVECLLLQSNKKVEEVETASRLKSQLWDKKENNFQSYTDNQQLIIKVCSSAVIPFVLFLIQFLCLLLLYNPLLKKCRT
jgi:kinesin family protein C2/C3